MKIFDSKKVFNDYQLKLMKEHNIKVKEFYYTDEELTELWFAIGDSDNLTMKQQEELSDALADNNPFKKEYILSKDSEMDHLFFIILMMHTYGVMFLWLINKLKQFLSENRNRYVIISMR